MEDISCRRFFTDADSATYHRQYEALRAIFPLSIPSSCYPIFGGRGGAILLDDRAIPSSFPCFRAPSTVRLGPGLPF